MLFQAVIKYFSSLKFFKILSKRLKVHSCFQHAFVLTLWRFSGIASVEGKKELFKELKLMAEIGEHPNVVNLLGACSQRGDYNSTFKQFCLNCTQIFYIDWSIFRDTKSSQKLAHFKNATKFSLFRVAYTCTMRVKP